MNPRNKTILVVVLGFAVGWVAHGTIYPQKQRPILNAIARVIRNWWWVPLLLDEPKTPGESSAPPVEIYGQDGYPIVQHGRSI